MGYGDASADLTCPRCKYAPGKLSSLLKHLSRAKHCDVVPGGKDVDPKAYAKQLTLVRNVTKPFVCALCFKHYATQATLRTHMGRVHDVHPPVKPDNESELVRVLPFKQEALDHLFDERVHPKIRDIMADGIMNMEQKFVAVVKLIFNDPLHPENQTVAFEDATTPIVSTGEVDEHGASVFDAVTIHSEAEKIIRSIKRVACMALQHPLAFLEEDSAYQELVDAVGLELLHEVRVWTNRVDMADEDPEFDLLTDRLVVSALLEH